MARKVLYFVSTLLLVLGSYLVFEYFGYKNNKNELISKKGQETLETLKVEVDEVLSKIVKEGGRLAQEFGSHNYSAKEVEEIIKESSLSISEIHGVTACYEPFSFSSDQRLYCPYYNKGESDYLYVGKSYDYSLTGKKGTDWYTSVRDNGAKWVEPYFAKGAQDWYVDYGVPFYYNSGPNKGKVRGTITMSFTSSGFKELVHSMSIGKTGYGIIISEKGQFLVHPINDYIGTTNLKEVIEKEKNKKLTSAFKKLLDGENGKVDFFDHEEEKLFYFDEIPTSKWKMGLMFFKADLLGEVSEINQRYIRISLVFSLLLICLLAIFYSRDILDENEIWQLSLFSTVLFLANIFLIGYLQHNTKVSGENVQSPPILDMASLGSFISQQHTRADKLKIKKATAVPTGLYLQRIEFQDSFNLNIGGTVWQKYPLSIADKVEIGFSFPQTSPFAESAYIEETYRKTIEGKEGEEGHLLVGWDVRLTLLLNLNYADFPFDKRHLSIELKPLNNNDHIIFTPDLASYNYTNPSRKSGLNPNILISGNEILESYFNYSLQSYDSDFGYGEKGLFEEVPILHFNIELRRKLLNSFVTYLIPIFVTLIIVFFLILSCTQSFERQGVIESMAAFFFVLIFSHIDLRKEIVTADLIYMEYFYFISYFMLVLSTLNLITYTKGKSDIFNFNNNQIFKALFFPINSFLILVITLISFY